MTTHEEPSVCLQNFSTEEDASCLLGSSHPKRSSPTPSIEVVLRFNGVEDLEGFKVKQLIPRGSLEELKGFNCAVCKESNNYIGGLTSTNNRSFHIFFFKSNDVEVLIAAINALENIL
ncbi:hypothetical protein M9H77_27295 [Catharanthus roseus]|uniref:Uncharacterized protein n=1 Tax=Catharanthus roseus TaxID=4058 RepID=A0ACC0AES9_CATRO|nr:hypothetical protein M9H77_27295 [Catharanthus roseus]